MKALLALLVLLIILLQYQLWIKPGNLFQAFHLKHQLQQITADNEKLKAKNEALEAEIYELKQGRQAVEQHARHDLGMIKKGETFYQVVP